MRSKKNKRDDFLSLVDDSCKRVLDVGCGIGTAGKKLKERGIEVVGIEVVHWLANEAKEHLDHVITGDVETADFPYEDGYFDCIMFGDVLEHLVDPLALLKSYQKYLNPKGKVIASIPNIRYYRVIQNLLFKGTWDYMEKGILDKTHLRFFTLINMKELFWDAGFQIDTIHPHIMASRAMKVANFICFNKLRNLITYQYYIEASLPQSSESVSYPKRKVEVF